MKRELDPVNLFDIDLDNEMCEATKVDVIQQTATQFRQQN
jgi:hypothetical protein